MGHFKRLSVWHFRERCSLSLSFFLSYSSSPLAQPAASVSLPGLELYLPSSFHTDKHSSYRACTLAYANTEAHAGEFCAPARSRILAYDQSKTKQGCSGSACLFDSCLSLCRLFSPSTPSSFFTQLIFDGSPSILNLLSAVPARKHWPELED